MSSSPASPADFQQALDLFRAQFAEQLPSRLEEVQEALHAWRAEPQSDERLRALHRVLHRLAGSAGTFGMPALGEACRSVELDVEELLARLTREGDDIDRISRAIAQLGQVRA